MTTTKEMIDMVISWLAAKDKTSLRESLIRFRDIAVKNHAPDSVINAIDSLIQQVPNPDPTPDPVPPSPVPPVPVPPVPPVPEPVTVTGGWRGTMFTPPTPGFPNNHGVTSQLDYRGIHGQSNEDTLRLDMFGHIQAWGGNVLTYIRGNWGRGNQVLDMCLNGRRHPGDGHYFPINGKPESDFAMWASQKFGITKHLCWIWNDDNSMPINDQTVKDAVDSYDGTRLGIENIAFGVCLETDEIMNADQAPSAANWIKTRAPSSPCIVGSANEGFLVNVASRVSGVLLWLEQSTNPVTAPLTRSTFPAYLASLNRLASKVGKARTIPGEWWASSPDDVAWITQQLVAAGYTSFGSGKFK